MQPLYLTKSLIDSSPSPSPRPSPFPSAPKVKTPIIKNILAAQSASGLEPVSMYLETVMYLSTTLYFVIRGDAFNETVMRGGGRKYSSARWRSANHRGCSCWRLMYCGRLRRMPWRPL
mgnify:CR=1 FL=1